MATSICCLSTISRFSVNVQDLALMEAESSEIRLSYLKWKIKICKTSTGYVAVYLESEDSYATMMDCVPYGLSFVQFLAYKITSLSQFFMKKVSSWIKNYLRGNSQFADARGKWSCEAQAAFKIRHKNGQNNSSVVKYLSKQEFSHARPRHGIEEFIEWDKFLEHFVVNNEAAFEVEILTNPMKKASAALDIDQSYVKFRIFIENLSKPITFYTPEIVIGGLRWKITIERIHKDLLILLHVCKEDMLFNWSYNVRATFSLVSYVQNVLPIRLYDETTFRRELGCDYGYQKSISWKNFIDSDKNYISGDCATLEFEIKVDEPKGDWEIGQCSLSKGNTLLECCICYDCLTSGKIYSTRCGHLYCMSCFKRSIKNRSVCSMCKAQTSLAELHPVYYR